METTEQEALKALERDKDRLIRHYMSLQDKADGINQEIYNTCCGIEALNVRISEMQARLKALNGGKGPSNGRVRQAAGGSGSRNGKAHPPRNSRISSE